MDNIIKTIIINHISNIINKLSIELKIDKSEIITKIYNNSNIIINNINIDMYDIYNNIGIDEISIGNTDYSNIELDNIFKSSH